MGLKQYAEREVRRRMKCATRLPGRAVATVTLAVDHAVVTASRADIALRRVTDYVCDGVESALDGACHLSQIVNLMIPDLYDPWDPERLEEWS